MSARERRLRRQEPTRRIQGAARRLGGVFLLAAEGGVPHALFNLGSDTQLLVVWMGSKRVYRAWTLPAGCDDRSRQHFVADVPTEGALESLLEAGRERYRQAVLA